MRKEERRRKRKRERKRARNKIVRIPRLIILSQKRRLIIAK